MTTASLPSLLRFLAAASLILSISACHRAAPPGNYDLVPGWAVMGAPGLPTRGLHAGQKVQWTWSISNYGTDDVPASICVLDFYLDGKSYEHRKITPDVPTGGGCFEVVEITMPAAGKYRYRLVVDEPNEVKETDETNNVLEGELEVLP
ncbi:MAG: CARDB domain-containing protein [Roseimicrobium sp.]